MKKLLSTSVMFVALGGAATQLYADEGAARSRDSGKSSSLMEPVDGISLQQWAGGNARLGQGVALASVLEGLKSTQEKWDHASKVWQTRMKEDHTFKVSTEYSRYFLAAGQGKYSAQGQDSAAAMKSGGEVSGKEPFSFEKWIEITQHQSVALQHGILAATILRKYYNMNPADWGTAGWWWSQKFNHEARKNNGALLNRFNVLTKKYSAQFKKQYAAANSATPDAAK